MQISKRSKWIINFSVLSIFLLVFLGRVGVVRAVFDEPHDAMVLYRVITETLPSTPAGRYYLDLLIKHASEIIEIVETHPEHIEMFMHTAHRFVPGFEALLDRKGDTVYITSEQVNGLKAELDWLTSIGSVALQKDIQNERQRLELDQFVGMTMNDAFDVINSNWTSDTESQLPFIALQELKPGQSVLIKDTAFVPYSGWKWAYYSIDGIYLEYSSSFYFEIHKVDDYRSVLNLLPSINLPFGQSAPVVSVQIVQNIPLDESATNPTSLFGEENVVWKNKIYNSDFDGTEFVVKYSGLPEMLVVAVLYSEKDQIAVGLQAQIREDNISPDVDYSVLLDQKYKYFQHMIENIRLH